MVWGQLWECLLLQGVLSVIPHSASKLGDMNTHAQKHMQVCLTLLRETVITVGASSADYQSPYPDEAGISRLLILIREVNRKYMFGSQMCIVLSLTAVHNIIMSSVLT